MKFLKQLSLFRFVRLQRFWGSLIYPFRRDWLNYRAQNSHSLCVTEATGTVTQTEPLSRGGRFSFGHLELEIWFLTPDLVRVNWSPGLAPIPYAIDRQDWEDVEVALEAQDDRWILSSPALQVIVHSDGCLKFQDARGQVIREELPPKQQVRLSRRMKGEGWLHQALLRSEERIYGLGERAAPLNLRTPSEKGTPRTYQMWNSDQPARYGPGADPLYLCLPLYLGLHHQGSYLMFYENSFPADFCFSEVAKAEFDGGALRYYLAIGPVPQLLERYSELTGHPPLPPRWALGYHQSRWGYETEAAVRQTALEFQARQLPLSAIHLDIDCQEDFQSFSIDPDRFPTVQAFSDELMEQGVRLIAITNPGIQASHRNKLFEEGRTQGIFCTLPNGKPILAPVWSGYCAFPDFTHPQARHWWSRQYEYLLDLGITGFWHDMNEPAVLVLWGDRTLPPQVVRHHLEGRGGDHCEAHNLYGFQQARAGYESLRDYRPEQRPFIVSRAGWAGLQRYAWTWTGDIAVSWDGLRQTISTVLGLGLSGIPYSGSDIGGFKGDPTPELYLRWFQMACFHPFYRTHCSNDSKPRTPWGYGEPYLSITREFLQLRYRLLPYFYTLAWQATQTGHPLVRPLFWVDPQDDRLWDIDDAFLLGESLLVAPIVQKGATSRSLHLPRGGWYHFWDDALLREEQVELAAPLETIPLLVKAGTVLPMEEPDRLVLHLYPPMEGSCTGTVYSDAGDGYGEWRLDQFHLTRCTETDLELTWRSQGEFAFPYGKVRLHLHGMALRNARVDGNPVSCGESWLETCPFETVHLDGIAQPASQKTEASEPALQSVDSGVRHE